MNPGLSGKLVRAARTSTKILKEPKASKHYLIKLSSGKEKLIDSRCKATIGTMSNLEHEAKKLRTAEQSRWLGWRPVVRGVAMNLVDHPHGGGEGRSKSSGSHGRSSQTPWGKPCKSGFKTRPQKKRRSLVRVVRRLGFRGGCWFSDILGLTWRVLELVLVVVSFVVVFVGMGRAEVSSEVQLQDIVSGYRPTQSDH
ncbi:hypothetical protein LOK49_LG10G03098 [Camellia lanceoleosa]|uniref:Uncharacterized protein n=1 Tax=Camellia lanceoleosa TaxID=1840588 RepID=A0ACC0G8I5_9ERIC|nr:hypothetical protein LOK49_LG10G03098 [Camellia lanceoleosa]